MGRTDRDALTEAPTALPEEERGSRALFGGELIARHLLELGRIEHGLASAEEHAGEGQQVVDRRDEPPAPSRNAGRRLHAPTGGS